MRLGASERGETTGTLTLDQRCVPFRPLRFVRSSWPATSTSGCPAVMTKLMQERLPRLTALYPESPPYDDGDVG